MKENKAGMKESEGKESSNERERRKRKQEW